MSENEANVRERKSKKKTLASVRCRLNFPNEQVFIEKYARHISKTGIFAKTSKPKAVGEQLKFEFLIADGTPVIRGKGEVTWNRIKESASGAPPGMGIKFLSLDEKGREILGKVMAYKKSKGDDFNKPSLYSMAPGPEEQEGDMAEDRNRADAPENRVSGAQRVKREDQKLDIDNIDALLEGIVGKSLSVTSRVRRKSRKAMGDEAREKRAEETQRRREEESVAKQREAGRLAAGEAAAGARAAVVVETVPQELPETTDGPAVDVFAMLERESAAGYPSYPSEQHASHPAMAMATAAEPISGVEIERLDNVGADEEVDFELDALSEIPPPPTSSSSPTAALSEEDLKGIMEDVYGTATPKSEPLSSRIIQDNELDALLSALEEDDGGEDDDDDDVEELDDLEVLELDE